MTNAELIKALRTCADEDKICTRQQNCGYYGKGFFCQDVLMSDAADALEELQQIADHHEQTAKDYWKEACEYKQRIAQLESNNPIVESVLVDKLQQRIDELENDKTNLEAEIINLEIALDKAHCELEAQIPKEGEWINEQRDRWIYAKCNLCGKVQDVRSNYCPNCGAKMANEQKRNEEILFGGIENV